MKNKLFLLSFVGNEARKKFFLVNKLYNRAKFHSSESIRACCPKTVQCETIIKT